jgi:hypothetical protein
LLVTAFLTSASILAAVDITAAHLTEIRSALIAIE